MQGIHGRGLDRGHVLPSPLTILSRPLAPRHMASPTAPLASYEVPSRKYDPTPHTLTYTATVIEPFGAVEVARPATPASGAREWSELWPRDVGPCRGSGLRATSTRQAPSRDYPAPYEAAGTSYLLQTLAPGGEHVFTPQWTIPSHELDRWPLDIWPARPHHWPHTRSHRASLTLPRPPTRSRDPKNSTTGQWRWLDQPRQRPVRESGPSFGLATSAHALVVV